MQRREPQDDVDGKASSISSIAAGIVDTLQSMLDKINISDIQHPMEVFTAMAGAAKTWWNKKTTRYAAKTSHRIIEDEIARAMAEPQRYDIELATAVYQ